MIAPSRLPDSPEPFVPCDEIAPGIFDDPRAVGAFADLVRLGKVVSGWKTAFIALPNGNEYILVGDHGEPADTFPRLGSFSEETLRLGSFLGIEDARVDPRFESHLKVKSGRLVAFAGEPLIGSDGHPYGVIVLQNDAPATLSPNQREAFQCLRNQAVETIERYRVALSMRETQERTRRFNDAMLELTNGISASESLEATIQRVSNTLFTALDVDRVGYWKLDLRGRLVCEYEADLEPKHVLVGTWMTSEDNQPYFDALESVRHVVSPDALNDSRTVTFRDDYLIPRGVRSLLDTVLRVEGQMVGVLCAESRRPREWREEEVAFCGAVANLIELAIEQDRVREISRRSAENERLLRIAIDTVEAALFRQNPDHSHTWMYMPRFGYTVGEVVGKTDHDLMPAESADIVRAIKQRVFDTGDSVVEEISVGQGPAAKHFRLSLEPDVDEQGHVIGLIGAAYDITSLKATQRALAESEQRLRSFFEESQSGLAIIAPDGTWMRFNATLAKMFGETLSSFSPGCLPPVLREMTTRNVYAIVHFGRATREFEIVGDAPIERSWRVSLTPLLDVLDQVSSVGLSITETTAQRNAENALRYLNTTLEEHVMERTRELAERNRDLEQFSYAVSHDLRSPLRAIAGYSKILVNEHAGDLSPDGLEMLTRMQANALKMAHMLDGILSYSRLGLTVNDPETLDLRPVLRSLVEEALANSDREPSVELDLAEVSVTVDREALVIAMRNLLNNAIKFTNPVAAPHIRVRTRVDRQRCFIEVVDNGIGFDMAYSEKIFKIFERLDHRANQGTGIGLALVARAAKRMAGKISAQSSPGQGAHFTLEIPTRGRRPRRSSSAKAAVSLVAEAEPTA